MSAGLSACAVDNPFQSTCTYTANRTLTFETDPSCLVRMYVLGDAACSGADQMTIVDG